MEAAPTDLASGHATESQDRSTSSELGRTPLVPVIGLERTMSPGADADIDGRTLRRKRNRDAVIVALLDIVREGHLDPSVADIAERAGVSHRSVFRYFDDINDLVRTAIEHEVAAAMPLGVIADLGSGSVDRRIDSWVDSRLRIYSYTHEVQRVARHRAPTIPAIDDGLKAVVELARGRMHTHFATELESFGVNGELVLDAAMILTSFESYDMHRRMFGHGIERIRQVWHTGLAALLATE